MLLHAISERGYAGRLTQLRGSFPRHKRVERELLISLGANASAVSRF